MTDWSSDSRMKLLLRRVGAAKLTHTLRGHWILASHKGWLTISTCTCGKQWRKNDKRI